MFLIDDPRKYYMLDPDKDVLQAGDEFLDPVDGLTWLTTDNVGKTPRQAMQGRFEPLPTRRIVRDV